MEFFIKWPYITTLALIREVQDLFSIYKTPNIIWRPVHTVLTEFGGRILNLLNGFFLGSFDVVVIIGVHRDVHYIRFIAYMFKDIDLSGCWPSAISPIRWQHPCCWPSASASWNLRPNHKPSI